MSCVVGCAPGNSGNCLARCKITLPKISENTSLVVELYKPVDGCIKMSMMLSKVSIVLRVRIIVGNFSNAALDSTQ